MHISRRGQRLGTICLLMVSLLAACARPDSRTGPPAPAAGHPLLVEAYVNGNAADGSDQFLRLFNPLQTPVDLAGWSIGNSKYRATFPDGARLGSNQTLYVAKDADGFRNTMGAPPDFVWVREANGPNATLNKTAAAGGETPPLLNGGASLRFDRVSGIVFLRDGAGDPVDTLVYGAALAGTAEGWRGDAAPSPAQGEIIDRGRDESTWSADGAGGYRKDTDRAVDWKHGSTWMDQRVYRPGQTWFTYPTYQAARVTAYATPDSAYRTVVETLEQAKQSIDLNVYDFSEVQVAERLAAAARRGVKVRLLMEAGSLSGLYNQERYVGKLVREAGGEVRWILNDPKQGIYGRYVYDHAKYAVVDGQVSLVQSENFVRHGLPVDPSFGNRGWGVVVEDRALAAYLTRVFEGDWSSVYGDSFDYKVGSPLGPPPPDFVPENGILSGQYPHPFPALTVQGPVTVTPVLAPDHALLDSKGIIGMMRSARTSLLIQQQYIHLHWGGQSDSPATTPDLFLQEAIAAARRGVQVRILLSDAFLDPEDAKDNTNTVSYVNAIAKRDGLDMQARIVKSDLGGIDKIHNKGLIVDGHLVMVTSINWSHNSPANNREVGLLLDHPEIGAFFSDIFAFDWYDGTPADYPLITEVNPQEGWIELTHYGSKPAEIGDWTLATGAGQILIPPRTLLVPGRPLILARDAAALEARYGRIASLIEVKGVALRPDRDAVRLRQGDRTADMVAWGDAAPGWRLEAPGARLVCRPVPGKDTNTYLDWVRDERPSPGVSGCGR